MLQTEPWQLALGNAPLVPLDFRLSGGLGRMLAVEKWSPRSREPLQGELGSPSPANPNLCFLLHS